MSKNNSFFSDKKFTDKKLFPYGISRSGDFSLAQTLLLEQHGNAYRELQQGLREPINEEETTFIEVFKGNKDASTPHELVWKRFLEKTRNKVKVSSFSSRQVKSDSFDGAVEEEEW
ncbi:DUF413 domain-containing protein [Alteromonadaceae bacterium M269]|jgi:uncharacterized protein YifE (UPF0438 family)|nr:DUF413 domain-containing protein [Alteromonadaceae bacterium M269]